MKVQSERKFRCVTCLVTFFGSLTGDGDSKCNKCQTTERKVSNSDLGSQEVTNRPFKVGDRVRCVEKEADQRLANAISLGQSYEVTRTDSSGYVWIVDDCDGERAVFASRFILADATPAPVTGATSWSSTGVASTTGPLTFTVPGFVKHDSHKPRVDLIPPAVLVELGHVLRIGAEKYSASNWAKGADWSRYIGAALRHIYAFASGEDKDPESGYSHLAHAMACICFLFEYARCGIGKDDRWTGKAPPSP